MSFFGEHDHVHTTEDRTGDVKTFHAPQTPVFGRQWSWDSKTLTIAAIAALALGYGVWFLMQYSAAKKAATSGSESE